MSLTPVEAAAAALQDTCFAVKRLVLGSHQVRRTRLYCVGSPKSGTHSIAEMFSRSVRARHQPRAMEFLRKLRDRREGRISEEQFHEWLRQRDRKMGLEVDSAAANFMILDFLLREFPDARFILTIRDCYSWLNSYVNHSLRFEEEHRTSLWTEWRNSQVDASAFRYAPQERILEQNGLPNVDGYYTIWSRQVNDVTAKVPAERLLIVRTDQITTRAPEIAQFAGLPARVIRARRAHAYKNPKKKPLLMKMDRNFIEEKVERHCRPIMSRYFPEIKSLDDARL